MYLSVIIPAYNEKSRLPSTLKKVREYLSKQKFSYEVIVVDDGSTDETKKVTTELVEAWPYFRVIGYPQNHGKGYAVKTGMQAAKGEWCLFMDADSSTDISEVEKMLPSTEKYNIVIGSRYLDPKSIEVKQPFFRRLISRTGNLVIKIYLGLNFYDTQCGFKIFSQEAAKKIFDRVLIDRWGFDIEILAIAKNLKIPVKEVPISWYNDPKSQLRAGSAIVRTFKELIKIKNNLKHGKYNLGE